MIKVRIHGTLEEVSRFINYLYDQQPKVNVLCASAPYADGGNSQYVRVYMDVELKTNVPDGDDKQ